MTNNFSKNSTFLLIFLLFLILPGFAHAETLTFTPEVPVGDSSMNIGPSSIGNYIKTLYQYSMGVIGILATVVLMWGGIRWIASGGSPDAVSDAKAWIMAAISGLVIALSSYSILYLINPDLVRFKGVRFQEINGTNPITAITSSEDCEKICPAGYQYDPDTKDCDCIGSGTHKECQSVAGFPNNTYECVNIPFPGEDTCTDNAMCLSKMNCCSCTNLFSSKCMSDVGMTDEECVDYCGLLYGRTFETGTLCDAENQCI